jgi:WhiB family redox-sensing transcriptional regulator
MPASELRPAPIGAEIVRGERPSGFRGVDRPRGRSEAPRVRRSSARRPIVTLPCHSVDPELFFAESPAQLELAKDLCTECPVRRACLAGALARREAAGVWGGQIFDNGEIIASKRGRGRPRKDAASYLRDVRGGHDWHS